jgi:arginase
LINERLAGAALDTLQRGAFPLVVGGDHTFSIGSIAAAGHYCHENALCLGVLWIDAHPDLNTPETTPSGNIHGMVLGAALGLWPSPLSQVGGNPDFVAAQLAYAGLRSIDPGEQAAIERLAIYAYSATQIHELGTSELLRQLGLGPLSGIDYLHVSLDLDAADPSIAPGVSTPEPDGLSEDEITAILAWASRHPGFRSMDIAELNPLRDIDGRTAALAVRLARVALACSPD